MWSWSARASRDSPPRGGCPGSRTARRTFLVVGAGHTGTEVAAQGQLFTRELARRHPRLAHVPIRWLLLDTADHVLPGMQARSPPP